MTREEQEVIRLARAFMSARLDRRRPLDEARRRRELFDAIDELDRAERLRDPHS